MKQIKFRGKSKITGKIIYGDLTHYKNGFYIDDEAVFEDAVAQFIGYDCDDKEIYSDDIVIDHDGAECPFYILLFEYDEIGSKFTNIKLKESTYENH